MGIKLENVCKKYSNSNIESEVLKNISLEIENGELVVILGPSGSGKSTLLNVISGLDIPSSGNIYVDNKCISSMKDEELTLFRRQNLGFVFQQYNLFQNLTVKENVDMGALISKNPFNIDEIIEKVGLIEHKNKYPSELSGGQMQRVSIARSIVKNPKILFCDEPTGALDENASLAVLELVESMNKTFKTTIVMITHNLEIAKMADKVIKINSGVIKGITINKSKMKAKELTWG